MLKEIAGEEAAIEDESILGRATEFAGPGNGDEQEGAPLTHAQLADRWLEVVATILLAIVAVTTA